jgi:hypothetical protein
VRLTAAPPSVSQLSVQCVILTISQPYRPPRPVIERALFVLLHDLCYNSAFAFAVCLLHNFRSNGIIEELKQTDELEPTEFHYTDVVL